MVQFKTSRVKSFLRGHFGSVSVNLVTFCNCSSVAIQFTQDAAGGIFVVCLFSSDVKMSLYHNYHRKKMMIICYNSNLGFVIGISK